MDITYARLKDTQEQFDKDAGHSINMMLKPLTNGTDRSRSPSPNAVRPLLHIEGNNTSDAPLAHIETDDEHDDREVVNRPYPGVDDGFFTNGTNTENVKPSGEDDSGHPDVELINHKEPEDIPTFSIVPRLGPDDNDGNPQVNPDQPDAAKPPTDVAKVNPTGLPDFPGSPGFRPWGYDFELGNGVNTLPSGETIPDLNVYQHKKTLAQGMMDLALFSANANQLRYVLETFRTHPYYYPSLALISISLLLQVAVGIGLVWNATYNVKDKKALCIANKINNFTIIGVFLVTVINVFISAFGVAPAPA
ncbi:uncharacterized protein LOC115875418 [Sitophilus oryzae]|uniref:Uncharacterized protein LOC115875418 n=1 Tax=Sitophilus oryzae TaxID=7048 RepID=A0A6J2X790_SITOR|nr:uncharacterized protein LOC115875418 [Sitophilus oryzae]